MQRPAMNWQLLEHQCHCLQSSKFYITIDWEAGVQERSPYFKIDEFSAGQMDKKKSH